MTVNVKLVRTTAQEFFRYLVDCSPSGFTGEQHAVVILMNKYRRIPAIVMKQTSRMSDWVNPEPKFKASAFGLLQC